ncbi:MAG: hypothetical protein KGI98_17020 [Euryarchaeota archaeon]|nr:hypothetical protein [Euryarchaeota archaeon]
MEPASSPGPHAKREERSVGAGGDPPEEPGHRPTARRRGKGVAALVGALVVASAVLLALWVWPHAPPVPGPHSTVSTHLLIAGSGGGSLGPYRLGVNVRADGTFGAYEESLLAATPANVIRWPGGALADRYNGTVNGGQGLIYNDDGTSQSATASLATFASWCLSTQCTVIYTLPAEIGNPAAAAYQVGWIEANLGLHPLYWEIGNEPALWTHFQIPWSQWSPSQDLAPSPAGYASVAASYALAIHQVDPSAKVLGLGGVGKGGGTEAAWINATLSAGVQNGVQQFAGVAIHVYPAGSGYPGETDEQVYAALDGPPSLASRVQTGLADVQNRCAACVLYVDELGAASGSTLASFMAGFPLVSFTAAAVIQGIEANASSLDDFVLEGGYSGAWTGGSGETPKPVYGLYQDLLGMLRGGWAPVGSSPAVVNLYAMATTAPTGNALLVANCDQNRTVDLSFSGSGFPFGASGAAWAWNSSSAEPVGYSWTRNGPENWTLPPEAVLLLLTNAPISAASHSLGPGTTTETGARTGLERGFAPLDQVERAVPRLHAGTSFSVAPGHGAEERRGILCVPQVLLRW